MTAGSGVRRDRLTLIVTAASPARHASVLVHALQEAGWTVSLSFSGAAQTLFPDAACQAAAGLVSITPLDDSTPPGMVLVAPATFHTIGQIANGISDTAVLNTMHRAIGNSVPCLMAPHVEEALARSPILARNLAILREGGVGVLDFSACDGGCPAEKHWPSVMAAVGTPTKS